MSVSKIVFVIALTEVDPSSGFKPIPIMGMRLWRIGSEAQETWERT